MFVSSSVLLQGMCHVGVRPLWLPPPPPKTPICSKLGDVFSQFPTVPTHKQAHSEGLIAAKLSQEKKKKKRCGGVKFLDALQLIKVSCFSLRDSWPACSLVSTKTRTPLVIHRQEIHPDANRQMCVCPCVFWCVR